MVQSNSFVRVLDKIEWAADKQQSQLAATRHFYQERDMKQAYDQAIRLEETSERLVLLTRVLPAYTGCPYADIEVENLIRLCIPVDIGFTKEGWFSVRIPALLPKKESGSADYIRSFLYPAMREFFEKQPPIRYRDCVLIYRHVYSRDRPERQKRDHDNIETNMVSDIVALYVMPDDGPDICSHYSCSAVGMEDRTEVYVIPKEEFPVWLMEEQMMPEEGVMLYEKAPSGPKKDM